MPKGDFYRYVLVIRKLRKERGEFCEACGLPSKHGHHVIPVGVTSIHSELVFLEANILILCDDCHALMHPLIRSYAWNEATIGRAQMLGHQT